MIKVDREDGWKAAEVGGGLWLAITRGPGHRCRNSEPEAGYLVSTSPSSLVGTASPSRFQDKPLLAVDVELQCKRRHIAGDLLSRRLVEAVVNAAVQP